MDALIMLRNNIPATCYAVSALSGRASWRATYQVRGHLPSHLPRSQGLIHVSHYHFSWHMPDARTLIGQEGAYGHFLRFLFGRCRIKVSLTTSDADHCERSETATTSGGRPRRTHDCGSMEQDTRTSSRLCAPLRDRSWWYSLAKRYAERRTALSA